MNNKGFTMIELLAIVTVLVTILIVSFPTIINMTKKDKERQYDDMVSTLCKAGETYIYENQDEFPKLGQVGEVFNLKIKKLIDDKLVDSNIENSKTNMKVENSTLKYKVEDDKSLSCQYIEPTLITTKDDYRGYYADVDGDGEPDGIIYADLAKGRSGQLPYIEQSYSYSTQTNLNEYVISTEKYTEGIFGERQIISLKKGSNGNSRFYVMALDDFKTTDYTAFYWYYNAYDHMEPILTSTEFGTGKENTRKMIEKWNAAGTSEGYPDSPQNNQDIWKYIQTNYQKGWYIPSIGEWMAFVDYMSGKEEDRVNFGDGGNYNTIYGLSSLYWSSSQVDIESVWRIDFYDIIPIEYAVNDEGYIRLGTTF